MVLQSLRLRLERPLAEIQKSWQCYRHALEREPHGADTIKHYGARATIPAAKVLKKSWTL